MTLVPATHHHPRKALEQQQQAWVGVGHPAAAAGDRQAHQAHQGRQDHQDAAAVGRWGHQDRGAVDEGRLETAAREVGQLAQTRRPVPAPLLPRWLPPALPGLAVLGQGAAGVVHPGPAPALRQVRQQGRRQQQVPAPPPRRAVQLPAAPPPGYRQAAQQGHPRRSRLPRCRRRLQPSAALAAAAPRRLAAGAGGQLRAAMAWRQEGPRARQVDEGQGGVGAVPHPLTQMPARWVAVAWSEAAVVRRRLAVGWSACPLLAWVGAAHRLAWVVVVVHLGPLVAWLPAVPLVAWLPAVPLVAWLPAAAPMAWPVAALA